MAVTTTPRLILDGAFAKSNANKPASMATDATEMLRFVTRAMRGLYAIAARVNPYFFAEYGQVAYVAGGGTDGWPRPETAESVFRIETLATTTPTITAGLEVVVVPQNDLLLAAGAPALYAMGKVFRPFTAGLITGGNINIYYSRRPSTPATLTAAVDAQWVETFDELLMLEVAILLAMKDRRAVEIPDLKEARNRWAQMFIMFLEHEHVNEAQRFVAKPGYNWQSLASLLAGGA